MLGQAEYAETLTNDVSGLLKEGADWATGVVQNSGQPMGALSALDWFAQNWIILIRPMKSQVPVRCCSGI